METKIEIYFSDLSDRVRRQLLELYGVKFPEELNWDKLPVFTFIRESEPRHFFIITHP